MTEDKRLIIIKGEDKTEDVVRISYSSGRANVTFKNSGKIYGYSVKEVKELTLTKTIPMEHMIATLDGEPLYNVKVIWQYEDWYKVAFEYSYTQIYEASRIFIRNKPTNPDEKSRDVFDYFRTIAFLVSVRTEDGTALLAEDYKKINYVDKDSALYSYIKNINKTSKLITNNAYIYPFGSNESQCNAIRRALENQISVIEGPPGTGKTQTILNIIANIVKDGKTVAVVSNNNAATSNVYEKLQKYDLDYICAPLGKNENKKKFVMNQTAEYTKLQFIPVDKYYLKTAIISLNTRLKEVFKLKGINAKAKEEIRDIFVEHKYYIQNEGQSINIEIPCKKYNNALMLKHELEHYEHIGKEPSLWFKIKYVLFKSTGNFKMFNEQLDNIIKACDKAYFIAREEELKEIINSNNEKIASLSGDNMVEELKDNSMQLLKSHLYDKYSKNNRRQIFSERDINSKSDAFTREYPVVFSTTHSIKRCLNHNYKYDYIIIDEASQVDLITGVLALSCAKNAVIVGDRKQLPNVISEDSKGYIRKVETDYIIPEKFDYLKHSFLTSVLASVENVPYTLLREHYRCHPKIVGFCNKKFYDNQLLIMTQDNGEKDVLKAYVTTEGNHARGNFNQREIDIINNEVIGELKDKVDETEIATIAPFRAQKKALNISLKDTKIQADTVHKFQGREKDAVIITTVQDEITDFVDDPQLLNVAVTRAKKYLRIVTNNKIEKTNGNFSDLIKYIKYNNFEVTEAKTKSIYDFLYKANREQRLKYLKDKKLISEYDSENITYNVVKKIIEEKGYGLGIATHISLKHIIKDMAILTEEERQFAQHEWTHTDILLYNKVDKMPVLCIEVDGYCYHSKLKQKSRDALKDSILAKCELPLLRLSTVGSSEEDRIINLLENLRKT